MQILMITLHWRKKSYTVCFLRYKWRQWHIYTVNINEMCFFFFLRRTSLARILDFGTLHKIRILGMPNRVGGFSCPVPNQGQRWWAIKTPKIDLTNRSISKIPNCSITLFALSSRGQVVLHHCRRTEVQDSRTWKQCLITLTWWIGTCTCKCHSIWVLPSLTNKNLGHSQNPWIGR